MFVPPHSALYPFYYKHMAAQLFAAPSQEPLTEKFKCISVILFTITVLPENGPFHCNTLGELCQ
jgi:hypothetical protein